MSPVAFTLVPALMAALVAGPILTACGTAFALGLGGLVVSSRNLGTFESYLEGVNAGETLVGSRPPSGFWGLGILGFWGSGGLGFWGSGPQNPDPVEDDASSSRR